MMRCAVLCLVVLLVVGTPAAARDPYRDDRSPAPPSPVVPPGVYYVTEVYVADVVTVSGAVTTYGTATSAETPGTYARVADRVVTGASSPFDGLSFNRRATLADGRPVAGTYYETFVLVDGSFVLVSVVFFQDDAEAVAGSTPLLAPVTTASPAAPRRIPVIQPGIAPSPLGDVVSSLEVLRGRPIAVWFRASVDGEAVPVSGWRVVAGEHTALGPASGGRDDPFRARWDLVTRPGGSWILRVEVTVALDGIVQAATGDIRIVVRSPALIR